jgi:hypothetical protein
MFSASTPDGTVTWSRTGLDGDLDLIKTIRDLEFYHVIENLKVGPITGPHAFADLADPVSAFLLISLAVGGDAVWEGDVPDFDFEVSEGALDGPNNLDITSLSDDTVGILKEDIAKTILLDPEAHSRWGIVSP